MIYKNSAGKLLMGLLPERTMSIHYANDTGILNRYLGWSTQINLTSSDDRNDCAATDISYNATTRIVSTCAGNGQVYLQRATEDLCIGVGPLSIVPIHDEPIFGIAWLSPHAFVTSGGPGILTYYDVCQARMEQTHLPAGAESLHIGHRLIYAGDAQGNTHAFDFRGSLVKIGILSLGRKYSSFPITAIETSGNSVYTAAGPCRKAWVWDKRNTKSPLGLIETQSSISSLLVPDQCYDRRSGGASYPFILTADAIVSADWMLCNSEVILRYKNEQFSRKSNLSYCKRYDAFVWSVKQMFYLWDGCGVKQQNIAHIDGMHMMSDDCILFHSVDGTLSTGKLSRTRCRRNSIDESSWPDRMEASTHLS